MPINSFTYDTNVLIDLVSNLKRPQSFLLDHFFPRIVVSDTEYVSIDVDVGKRRMSPFVSPLVEGKLTEQRRIQTNTFKPAYIKEKRAPDLLRPVRRMIGERIGGTMSGAEREAANLRLEMEDMMDNLTRRMEWMAAQALTTGTVRIQGEGFPTTVVDFGRDATNTIALTSGAQWTQANVLTSTGTPGAVSPSANIQAYQRQLLRSSGVMVEDIIFTTSSLNAFLLDPLLKGAILYPNQAPFGNRVNPAVQQATGVMPVGEWLGLRLWLYNDWYVDPATNFEYPMIPDGMMILTSPQMQGTRAFGQIIDPEFNYQSLAFAPKTWISHDPAQRFLMLQSSPIVIPSRANAAIAVQVVPSVYR